MVTGQHAKRRVDALVEAPCRLAVLDRVRVEDDDVTCIDDEIWVQLAVYVVDEEPKVFDGGPAEMGDMSVGKLYDTQLAGSFQEER